MNAVRRKRRGALKDWLIQGLALALVLAVFAKIGLNTAENLQRQGIASGFGFLSNTAGFDIGFHLISYEKTATYGRAFLVALSNTLLVSVLGVIAATFLGFAVGIGRLSKHPIVSRLSTIFVEVVRNVPLLLQIFVWYFGVLRNLPMPRSSLSLGDVIFLNVRGLYVPRPSFEGGFHWDIPKLAAFDYEGGWALPPELVALGLALAVYTAAFIAEIVRAGIKSIDKGQVEAAASLGLSPWQSLRFVVIPQAMRVIVPPLTSQYLNLTKNSSLAAAVGYPDIVLVFAGSVLMQTGQAVEVMAITMGVYLFLSLVISLVMNLYNRRTVAWGERQG